MPELRDVSGESERLRQRRQAVLESSKALDQLTHELGQQPAEEPGDPRAEAEALRELADPDARA